MSNSSQNTFSITATAVTYTQGTDDITYSRPKLVSKLVTLFMDFASLKSYLLTNLRKDNYLYVSGTMEDDQNNPPLLWNTSQIRRKGVCSARLLKPHRRKL